MFCLQWLDLKFEEAEACHYGTCESIDICFAPLASTSRQQYIYGDQDLPRIFRISARCLHYNQLMTSGVVSCQALSLWCRCCDSVHSVSFTLHEYNRVRFIMCREASPALKDLAIHCLHIEICKSELDISAAWHGVTWIFIIGPTHHIPSYLSSLPGVHCKEQFIGSAADSKSAEVYKEGAADSWSPTSSSLRSLFLQSRALHHWQLFHKQVCAAQAEAWNAAVEVKYSCAEMQRNHEANANSCQ